MVIWILDFHLVLGIWFLEFSDINHKNQKTTLTQYSYNETLFDHTTAYVG